MSEERDLSFVAHYLVCIGANKMQVRGLSLLTIMAVSSVAAENERVPPENCVCGVGTTARSHV